MPLRIALCDDEAPMIAHLRASVSAWAAGRGEPVAVLDFPSADAFLFAWEEDRCFDIVVLDIQMPGMDGMSLARTLRQADERVQLLFVTGYADYLAEGYDVAAVHYLLKPVEEERLFAALDRAAARLARAEPMLALESDGTMMRIPQREIRYLEAVPHGVQIVGGGAESHRIRMPLAEIEAQLEDGAFVRCHRSFLVGIRHIRRILKTDVLLDDGRLVPLSRRMYKAVHDAFIRYYKEDAACETPSPG